jgi:hypothetical protein
MGEHGGFQESSIFPFSEQHIHHRFVPLMSVISHFHCVCVAVSLCIHEICVTWAKILFIVSVDVFNTDLLT